MSAHYLVHLTKTGERWDQIAYRYYGDAMGYERIIAANPHVPIVPILEGGIRLSIPVIEKKELFEELPPWKR